MPSDVALENTCIVATFSFQPSISKYFSNQLLWAKLDLRKGPRGMRLLPADYNLTVMELHAITRPAPHWPRGTQSLNKGKCTLQCSHCVLQSGAQQRGFNIFQWGPTMQQAMLCHMHTPSTSLPGQRQTNLNSLKAQMFWNWLKKQRNTHK